MDPLGADDPQVIGAYRLLGRLGSGGMGRVYVGRSAGGRTVAVKVVHAQFALDEEFRARFRREVDAARRVGGAFTAPVLDADPEARIPWVATGYVAGPPLSQAVSDEGPLPEASVRALGAGLAEALAAVHALGLVHRDVKPSNVLLALDGPRLIDFGIARATEGTVSLTSTGASIGSPGYMSPEQILGGDVAGPADIFSLGAVLAYAATGKAPFPGDSSAALLYKVVHDEPRFGPELTGELRDLVAACLAKSPADRPTPERIVRRLAPDDGASALARPGWLPGALVERVGRQVVELLDLEAEAVAPRGDTEPPAAGPPAGDLPTPPPAPAPPVLGAFGPPDPSYANGLPAEDRPSYANALPAEDRPPYAKALPAEDRPPGHPPGHPLPSPPAPEPGGRGVALSAAVGGKKRPRALSCTLVLSVAGALAAATTAAVAFHLLPGAGGGQDDHSAAKSPPASAANPGQGGDAAGGGEGAVPKAFLGTWQGELTSDSGIPVGTLTITFRQGRIGQDVASGRVKLSVLRCDSAWKLVSATPKQLHLDARLKGSEPQQGCSDASTDERFTLTSDREISYRAKDKQAGDPTGTLRKLR
ncbi:serine/threonine-protein kinase [Streptomyces hygroscopicus]|uniref:serine/threonine-protein kinase n=1 Tax=Streptomyces hygroscopicus TaxID=1912 RepID=UPI0037981B9A